MPSEPLAEPPAAPEVTRIRISGADRAKAFRRRRSMGTLIAPTAVGTATIERLIEAGVLAPQDREDRTAVGQAVSQWLAETSEHPDAPIGPEPASEELAAEPPASAPAPPPPASVPEAAPAAGSPPPCGPPRLSLGARLRQRLRDQRAAKAEH